jgi:hypothetical protein
MQLRCVDTPDRHVMHEKINNLESIHYTRIAVQRAVIGVKKLLQNHGITDAPADYQMSFT